MYFHISQHDLYDHQSDVGVAYLIQQNHHALMNGTILRKLLEFGNYILVIDMNRTLEGPPWGSGWGSGDDTFWSSRSIFSRVKYACATLTRASVGQRSYLKHKDLKHWAQCLFRVKGTFGYWSSEIKIWYKTTSWYPKIAHRSMSFSLNVQFWLPFSIVTSHFATAKGFKMKGKSWCKKDIQGKNHFKEVLPFICA